MSGCKKIYKLLKTPIIVMIDGVLVADFGIYTSGTQSWIKPDVNNYTRFCTRTSCIYYALRLRYMTWPYYDD